ncbi:hypothetical protein [Virgibacillus oceani]|uniref:Uncharacterized protein n=1 Tax=Virgibacillus oceani TaxID=1479511 RepID=A0A917HHI6_9BACI|nr:hypothetical protein [Virgibacillus oceani]GGG79490.1 hypothetical protein GCM10011398_26040 [Virgibacillus oceani]
MIREQESRNSAGKGVGSYFGDFRSYFLNLDRIFPIRIVFFKIGSYLQKNGSYFQKLGGDMGGKVLD